MSNRPGSAMIPNPCEREQMELGAMATKLAAAEKRIAELEQAVHMARMFSKEDDADEMQRLRARIAELEASLEAARTDETQAPYIAGPEADHG